MVPDKYWKQLTWVMVVFLLASVVILAHNTIATGSFMKRDIDLSGGKEITVLPIGAVDISRVRSALPDAEVKQTSSTLVVVVPSERSEAEVLSALNGIVQFEGEPSIRIIGASVANAFFQNAQIALIMAFVLMALVVFMLFRSPVPSSIVILAATTDIVGTMAVLSVIGVALSLPVLVALLMLIGYSVDTDILLTNELLKSGRNDYKESVRRAMKTGLTFTCTTLVALAAMYLVSGSLVIEQIALVLIIGLMIDVPATWLTNAGVMRMWMERRHKVQ